MSTPGLETLPLLWVDFPSDGFSNAQKYSLNFGRTVQFYARDPSRNQALRHSEEMFREGLGAWFLCQGTYHQWKVKYACRER